MRIQVKLAILLTALICPLVQAAEGDGWIPFELNGGHISVPTSVGGISGFSIIDTGAAGVMISESLAAELDLKIARNKFVDVTGVTGTQRRVVYQRVPANIFGADLEFKNVTDMSFGSTDMQLLVGGPILQMFVFQFDYPGQRMRALPRDAVDLKAVSNIVSRRDSRGSKLPVVEVDLNGEDTLWLTMDTGNNSGLLINRKVAAQHGWLERFPLETGYIAGVNGVAETQSFMLPSLQFGPVTLENVRVTVPAKNVRLPAVERSRQLSEGLLGYDVLKHFIVSVDYKSGHVHVALP